jgi:Zn-finger nucleic acid-binding protein
MIGSHRRTTGFDPDGVAESEADHFATCPGCGQWFDLRELDQILVHFRDPEIEISEGPEPPPSKAAQ